MIEAIKDKWVATLRSGEYAQGHYRLSKNGAFCCLGVLCELAAQEGKVEKINDEGLIEYDGSWAYLPKSVMEWAGMKVDNGHVVGTEVSLAIMNDNGESFGKIADAIEKHWENL